MKKNRLLLSLVIVCSSFFLFLGRTYADTSVTLSEDPLTYINSDFYSVKAYAENYINSQTTYPYYFIYLDGSIYKVSFIYDESTPVSFTLSYNDRHLRIAYYKSTSYKRDKLVNGEMVYDYEGSGIPYADYWCTSQSNCKYVFLDTNVNTLSTNNETISLVYSDTTYTFTNSFKTVYQLYQESQPSDDTPLLTSFINVFIDRLAFITSSLHENYILLSCFTIFTMFFVIYLLRRLR